MDATSEDVGEEKDKQDWAFNKPKRKVEVRFALN
jgi:hypothetical protein